ncbi:MAG: factor-independent urate hydroxylase [Jatrophihabitans sp.]
MVRLQANQYGKAQVRLVRVTRAVEQDELGSDLIRDWCVSTSLSGDLDSAYLAGDNSAVTTTDTQKNMVFGLVKQLGDVEPEEFGLTLAALLVDGNSAINRARVSIEEYRWDSTPGRPHSFVRNAQHTRTTSVLHDRLGPPAVLSGVAELVVLNTTGSEFQGFPRDEYTTLPETTNRMLATEVTARWRFRRPQADWSRVHREALASLLDTFAGTYSRSVQQTLYAMGSKLLGQLPELCEVRLTLPNKHHLLVDLSPFGLANDNEVYHPSDRPYGVIEGTVLADDAPEAGSAWD